MEGWSLAELENGLLIAEMVIIAAVLLAVITWWTLKKRTRRRQEQVAQQSQQIQAYLGTIKQDMTKIEQGAQTYPTTDPEPYHTRAVKLHDNLELMQRRYGQQDVQFKALLAQQPPEPDSFFSWLLYDFGQHRRYWIERVSKFETLLHTTESLRSQVNDTQAVLQELHHLPIAVSQEVRELEQSLDQSLQIGLALQKLEVHGKTLDTAIARVKSLQGDLKKVPSHFFYGSDQMVLKETTKQDVVTAWRIVQDLRSAVQALLESFKEWQSKYQLIGQQVKAMRQAMQEAVVGLKSIPASVDMSKILEALKEAHKTFKQLDEMYPALTIEVFDDFADMVQQVTETVQRLIGQMGRINQEFQLLGKAITTNAALLEQVEAQMTEARLSPKHPMDWEHFSYDFNELRRIHKDIGNLNTKRTLELLSAHAQQAKRLSSQAERLSDQVNVACAKRLELLSLLEHEDLVPEPAWFTTAQTLHQQMKPYAPANWWHLKAAGQILDDAKNLTKRQKKWVPARLKDSLPVTQLSDMLTNLNKLITDLAAFKVRIQQVTDAFAALQTTEQIVFEQLETTNQALTSLIQKMQETKRPLDPDTSKYQQKLENLRKQNRKLASKLNNRWEGQVTEKAGKVDTWLKSCRKELQPLPLLFQAEIKAIEAELRSLVEAWPESIPFDYKEIKQALAIERPSQLPLPDKKMKVDIDRVMFYANQVDTQLQEREKLHALLKEVKAQFEELMGEQPQLLIS